MLLASSALASAHPSSVWRGLATIMFGTWRYHDVSVAQAAGYVPVSPCIEAPGLGAMGIHYLNPGLASDTVIDPRKPEILLYAPVGDRFRLVGVEYWSIALANTATGPAPWFGAAAPPDGFLNPPPSVIGIQFEGPMEGHDPTMPWHYDRHVWAWSFNPAGIFQQFNPRLSC